MLRFMKHVLLLVIVFGFFSVQLLEHSVSAAGKSSIAVIVEGSEVTLPVKPINVNGNIYLHAKSIFDALEIKSSIGKKSITVYQGDITFKAEVDQSRIYIGDRKLRLTQPPLFYEGRIYVPARFVGIVLGKDVKHESNNNQLIIGLTEEAKIALQRSLFEAARIGDALAVTNLIKRGADPNGKLIVEYGNNTPLDYAVSNNRTEAARALIKGGAKLEGNVQNLGFEAIVNQNVELLDILLANGLDPNYKGHWDTLLQVASGIIVMSEEGVHVKTIDPSPDIVNTLLKYGADPGLDDSLYQAVDVQNFSIIQSLLRAGADPYKMNSHGTTPYELSVSKNINRWMTIQKERTVLPTFSIVDADGSVIKEGDVSLRSLDDPKAPRSYISFSSGQIHVDVPNGNYQILHVMVAGNTYILPQNSSITIKDEVVVPSIIRLPNLNVRGTLTSESIPIADGTLILNNQRNSDFMFIEVKGNQFNLYAESGQYRIVGYRDASNNSYKVNTYFTVTGSNGIEDITVVVNPSENQF